MPHSATKKITAGFILLLIILGLLIILIITNSKNFISSSESISSRQQVLFHAEEILSQTIQIETNMRGYVLNGDKKFLKNHIATRLNVISHIQFLRGLCEKDRSMTSMIDLLEKQVNSKISFSDSLMNLVNENKMEAGQRLVTSGYGQEQMEGIVHIVNEIQNYQQKLLNRETASSVKDTRDFYRFLNIFIFIIMFLLIISFYLVEKNLKAIADAMNKIKENETRFRVLAETASDGIIMANSFGNIIFFNPSAEKIFGYTSGQIMDKSVSVLIPSRYRETHREGLKKYISTGDTQLLDKTIETEGLKKNGKEFPIEVSIGSWKNDDQHFFAGFIRDITVRKIAEQTIQSYADEIFDLYNNAPCGYHTLNKEGFFIGINNTELKWLGYERKEMLRKLNIADVIRQKTAFSFESGLNEILQKEIANDIEWEMVRKDGTSFPVLLNSTVIKDAQGNITSTRTTVYDITLRKTQEEAVMQSKFYEKHLHQLEEEYRDLESFSYIASHDLKSPLNNLEALLEQININSVKPESDEAVMFDMMKKLVNNMRKLIDDLLSFSKIGKTVAYSGNVNMDELVKQVMDELMLQDGFIKYQIEVKKLLPAKGDVNMIRQVWTNYISNAFKYSFKNEKPHIEIGSFENENSTVYYVKDNGIGFDMKDYPKLFSAFKRLHNDKSYAGTGIGIASVKRIIEKHNGQVWAEAEPGKGAVFYFSLPV